MNYIGLVVGENGIWGLGDGKKTWFVIPEGLRLSPEGGLETDPLGIGVVLMSEPGRFFPRPWSPIYGALGPTLQPADLDPILGSC